MARRFSVVRSADLALVLLIAIRLSWLLSKDPVDPGSRTVLGSVGQTCGDILTNVLMSCLSSGRIIMSGREHIFFQTGLPLLGLRWFTPSGPPTVLLSSSSFIFPYIAQGHRRRKREMLDEILTPVGTGVRSYTIYHKDLD